MLKPGSQAIIATVFGTYAAAVLRGGGGGLADDDDGGGGGGGAADDDTAAAADDDANDDGAGDDWLARTLAVGAILLLAGYNCAGARSTANLQVGWPRAVFPMPVQ